MKREVLITYLVCIALVIVGLIFDSGISEVISGGRIEIIDFFMIFISSFWTWVIVGAFLSVIMIYEKKVNGMIKLWIGTIASVGIADLIKLIFMRSRPFETLDITSLVMVSGSSFPSGHAAGAFAAMFILGKEFPKLKVLWMILAALVGVSRIYLGLHYLSDVAVGALLGLSIGLLVEKYVEIKK